MKILPQYLEATSQHSKANRYLKHSLFIFAGTSAVYGAPLYDSYDPDYTSQLGSSYNGDGENSSYESEQSNDSYSYGSEGYNPYGGSSLNDKLDDDDVKQIVKQVYEDGVDSLNVAP